MQNEKTDLTLAQKRAIGHMVVELARRSGDRVVDLLHITKAFQFLDEPGASVKDTDEKVTTVANVLLSWSTLDSDADTSSSVDDVYEMIVERTVGQEAVRDANVFMGLEQSNLHDDAMRSSVRRG